MQIHEYQAKQILKGWGLNVPAFELVASTEELLGAAKKLGGYPLIVRAQVHGEGGEERTAETFDELIQHASSMLGSRTGSLQAVAHELLLTRPPTAEKSYELSWSIKALNASLEIPEEIVATVSKACEEHELETLRVTFMLSEGDWAVTKVFMSVDEAALFRQRQWERFRDSSQSTKIDLQAARLGFFYKQLGGSIGCLCSGKGLSLAMAGLLEHYGREAGSILGIGEEFSKRRLESALQLAALKARTILIALVPGFMNCEVWAQGLIAAAHDLSLNLPVIVHLAGRASREAETLFLKAPKNFHFAKNLDEAARQAIILGGFL